ncbi:MAG: UDP-N-acetylmuramoyl-L-alanyl-D-glutamate--2,6-diaminopimelate ligase [Opitutaceae bacterium]
MIGYLSTNHALIAAFAPRPARRTRGETLALNRVFKKAPKLSDYFGQEEILATKGSLDRPISGLAMDSRRVAPGNVFFALPGFRLDGAHFVDEAMSRGAVAIVTENMPAHPPAKITFIHVANARACLARVSQCYYKFPDRDLSLVAVTGSSGKTTVAHLIQHFLSGDQRVGLIGTINYDLGARTVPSFRTTPESLDVYGMLAQMRDAGCRQAVVEVSSHGIDQQRVHGLRLGAAVFTNLSSEHLDYHVTTSAYFNVKTRLFNGENGVAPKIAVVNLDDQHGVQLAARIPTEVRTLTYGQTSAAQVRAENIEYSLKNTNFKLIWPTGAMQIESPLVGSYNLSNLLAAIATAYGLGRDPLVFLAKLRAFKGIAGRMERIEEGQGFEVLVDYAHSVNALRSVLEMLRPMTPGRLFVVFGCVGHRERTQRAVMAETVQEFADFAMVTADNPKDESLTQIFTDMQAGVTQQDKFTWIEDRRRAISLAIDACKPGDSLVIAGKGHESYQQLGSTVVPFDDREVARDLLRRKTPNF